MYVEELFAHNKIKNASFKVFVLKAFNQNTNY